MARADAVTEGENGRCACGTNDRAGRLRVLHPCVTFERQKYPKSPGKRCGKVAEVSPDPSAAMSDGNAAALAGKAPDPSAAMSDGNKVPKTSLSPWESEQPQADGEGVGADSISARAGLPPRGNCQRS